MSQSIVLFSFSLLFLTGDAPFSPANPIITSVSLGFALFSLLARDSEADNAYSRWGLGPMITSCRWISGPDSHLAALINADSICDRSLRQTHLCFIVLFFSCLFFLHQKLWPGSRGRLLHKKRKSPPETWGWRIKKKLQRMNPFPQHKKTQQKKTKTKTQNQKVNVI